VSKRIHHIKSDVAIGIGFLIFIICCALLLKIWLIWQALVVTIALLLLYSYLIFRIAKSISFYYDFFEEKDIFGRVEVTSYNDIDRIEINNISFKDTGWRFVVFKGTKRIKFVERKSSEYFFICNFLRDKGIRIVKIT
jgi:hypothetical protein